MSFDPWAFLTSDWQYLIPSPWLEAAEVAVALLCGVAIGAERERREKPAGLRALTLVCVGAAIYTHLGFRYGPDAGKIVAQIVTGVGFLGAGVIMRSTGGMIGITTAASIWVTAAIGATAGGGFGGRALLLAGLVRFVLSGLLFWHHHLIGGLRDSIVELSADPDHGKTRIRLLKILDDFHVSWGLVHIVEETEENLHLRISFRLLKLHRSEFLDALASLPAVRKIQEIGMTNDE
jgi:putative Mg2+ transporter-C (MgtC) family protein